MTTNREINSGNFSSGDDKPRAFHLTQKDWRRLSSGAFREFTKGKAKPSHVIADVVECSPKTAQSWLDGESTPAGVLNLRAMARVPSYAALTREIAEMKVTLDPRLQAKYQELHALTLALAGSSR